jgi:amidase
LRGFEIMGHCRAVSLLGAPVLSIPVDRSPAGLPLSVQIVGPPWAEDLVLALGRRIEALRGGSVLPPGAAIGD